MLLIDLKILITYSVNFSLLRQWTEKVVLLPFINIMSKNQWLNGPNQRCLAPTIKNIRKQIYGWTLTRLKSIFCICIN